MERAMGIEPTAQAWEAWVLPLYDARYRVDSSRVLPSQQIAGHCCGDSSGWTEKPTAHARSRGSRITLDRRSDRGELAAAYKHSKSTDAGQKQRQRQGQRHRR